MRKLNLTIALGVVAALCGAVLVLAYGRSIEQRIAEGKETIDVLVAATALPPGTAAEEIREFAKIKQIPRAYAPAGALADLSDVAGMVLSAPVSPGGQLSESMFDAPERLARLNPAPDHVAVAVQVDLSQGMARYVQPNAWVDVFVTYKDVGASQVRGEVSLANGSFSARADSGADERTKLFLSGVRVLSVSVAQTDPEAEEASDSSQPADQVIAVLEVRPTDAERVVNAATLGELYLGLSSEGQRHQTPKGVTPDDVIRANRGRGR